MTLSLGSRDEAVSFAEDGSLSLLQKHPIELGNMERYSDLANATTAGEAQVVYVKTHYHRERDADWDLSALLRPSQRDLRL